MVQDDEGYYLCGHTHHSDDEARMPACLLRNIEEPQVSRKVPEMDFCQREMIWIREQGLVAGVTQLRR